MSKYLGRFFRGLGVPGWVCVALGVLYEILDLISNLQTLKQGADWLIGGAMPQFITAQLIPITLFVVGFGLVLLQAHRQATHGSLPGSLMDALEKALAYAHARLEGVLQGPFDGAATTIAAASEPLRAAFESQRSQCDRTTESIVRAAIRLLRDAEGQLYTGYDSGCSAGPPLKAEAQHKAHALFEELSELREKLIEHFRAARAGTLPDDGASRQYRYVFIGAVAVVTAAVVLAIVRMRDSAVVCDPSEPKIHNLNDMGWAGIVAPYNELPEDEAEYKTRKWLCQWKSIGDARVIAIRATRVEALAAQDKIHLVMESDDATMVGKLHINQWVSNADCQVTSIARNRIEMAHCTFGPPPTATSTPGPTDTPTPTPTRIPSQTPVSPTGRGQ